MRRLTVILSVLALVVAGCSRGGEVSEDTLRPARSKTRAEVTTRYSMTVVLTQKNVGTSTSVTAKPEVVELKISGLWNMKEDRARHKLAYSTSAGGSGADYIVMKDVVYVSGSGAAPGKWKVFEGKQGGVGEDGLGVLRPDPVLETLAGLAGGVTKVGSEQVDGVKTTHYRGVADLKVATTRAEPDARAALKARLDTTETTKATIDAWLDDEGRVRRLVTFTTAKGGASTIKTTLDLSDFGVTADITAPAEADIDGPAPAS